MSARTMSDPEIANAAIGRRLDPYRRRLAAVRARFELPSWLLAVGPANALASAVLVLAAFKLAAVQPSPGHPLRYVLIPLTTLPLLAMRRHPAAAPCALAVLTLLTQLVAGPLVTCGVVLPTSVVMAFQLGSRLVSTRQLAIGGAGLIATWTIELVLDPVLGTIDAIVFVVGLGTAFFIGGLVVRSRVRMAETLRARTAELAARRDHTAALAVAADREQIAADLEVSIRSQVAAIAETAARCRVDLSDGDAGRTREGLAEIEREGRETLGHMRTVVGTLRDAPTEPPPGIADLAELVLRAGSADTRLVLDGEQRGLAPHLELSAYKIVEHLLDTVADQPRNRVDVHVRYQSDSVQIEVVGPPTTADPDPTAVAALTAARTRAEVTGGWLDAATVRNRRRIRVVLPATASLR